METVTTEIGLTVVLVEDEEGGYTAYFKEQQNIIAEGETVEEAIINLFLTCADVFTFTSTIFNSTKTR